MVLLTHLACKLDFATLGLNACRAQSVNCVQDGVGTTGGTFKGVQEYVVRHRPRCCILENVTELGEVCPNIVSDCLSINQSF